MFDLDQFITVKRGWLYGVPFEALADTGMLQQTARDWDKSVMVKQQTLDYVTFLKISFYRKRHKIFLTVFFSHIHKRAKYYVTLYCLDSAGTAKRYIARWYFRDRKNTTLN